MYLCTYYLLTVPRYLLTPEEKGELQRSEGLSPVIYVQSGCDCPSGRDALVRRLARHVGVDSYGLCLNNRTMPRPVRKGRDRRPSIHDASYVPNR